MSYLSSEGILALDRSDSSIEEIKEILSLSELGIWDYSARDVERIVLFSVSLRSH